MPTMGGYQMLVRGDVMRGKFRNSLSHPEPFVPDSVTSLQFALNDVFHRFKRGHRVMVHFQSSWFPMIDLNPGKFMNIFTATESDLQRTTQRIYRSPLHPSKVILPVMQSGIASFTHIITHAEGERKNDVVTLSQ